MSGDVADPLALIIAASGAAMSALLGLVVALVSARAKHIETKAESQALDQQKMWISATALEGRVRTNEAEIAALKRDTLTRELFEERTDVQDRKLDKLENRVERVGRDLSARPTRSETGMLAVRAPVRPDDRRESPSSDPPPIRPRLPSRKGE